MPIGMLYLHKLNVTINLLHYIICIKNYEIRIYRYTSFIQNIYIIQLIDC
jgi:hypothetical protein